MAIEKIAIVCPHCGATQQEPLRVQSTYCRSCGLHISLRKQASIAKAPPPPAPRRSENQQIVSCFACGNSHSCPADAPRTICPFCSVKVDLSDVQITARVSRIVETKGDLLIRKGGFLNNVYSRCKNASIDGQIAGELVCDGDLRLGASAKCKGPVRARKVLIQKGATMEFRGVLTVDELEIRGSVIADVNCSGAVRILKGGSLEGDVTARAFRSDKGAVYRGSLRIRAAASD